MVENPGPPDDRPLQASVPTGHIQEASNMDVDAEYAHSSDDMEFMDEGGAVVGSEYALIECLRTNTTLVLQSKRLKGSTGQPVPVKVRRVLVSTRLGKPWL